MLKYLGTSIVFSEIPDETTLAIDLSNCPNKCKGCHSPWLQNDIGFELTEKELDSIIDKYLYGITCICFMGGDCDHETINQFARHIKDKYRFKVAWYSGCDKMSDKIDLSYFDYYKIGHYDERYGALDSKETNQRMFKITKHGKIVEDITERFWKKT